MPEKVNVTIRFQHWRDYYSKTKRDIMQHKMHGATIKEVVNEAVELVHDGFRILEVEESED